MYKNRGPDGRCNRSGARIREYRLKLPGSPSQKRFADMLELAGLDVDKNAVQRMESGSRFITDVELYTIARVLGVSYVALLDGEE